MQVSGPSEVRKFLLLSSPKCRARAVRGLATAEQIKALIRSHIEGDEERFRALAIQLAAQAARKGQGKFAQELKRLLDQAAEIGDFPAKTVWSGSVGPTAR